MGRCSGEAAGSTAATGLLQPSTPATRRPPPIPHAAPLLTQVFPGTIRSVAESRVQGLVLFDLQPQELEVRRAACLLLGGRR